MDRARVGNGSSATLRMLATPGATAIVALSLAAAPASAESTFDYIAEIDCGSGR